MEIIINEDNCRTLTKENIVERIRVFDWLYILDEIGSIRMYLIIGSEKALLFDTGYGLTDFRPLIREVTDLPLIVVCSHGHDDHVLGNYLFDTVYISESDYELCLSGDNEAVKDRLLRSRYGKTPEIESAIDREAYMNTTIQNCEYRFVNEGDVFDLGGRTLAVYNFPGHTKGSIGLYCKESADFFCGDALMSNHELQYGKSVNVTAPAHLFYGALIKLQGLTIERIWAAHGNAPAGAGLIQDTKEMLESWVQNGDPEKELAQEGTVFGRPCKHRYKDMVMSYNPIRLEEIREYRKKHDGRLG